MIKVKRLFNKNQTGREMRDLVDRFSGDLDYFESGGRRLSELEIGEFYNLVKNVPYKKDDSGIEILTRPYHLLTSPFSGWDCKKKAIAMASWLKQNGIPYEFVAVSNKPNGDIHHVIIRATINGQSVQIDPTYKQNQLFEPKQWTNAEALSGLDSDRAPVLVTMYGDKERPNLSTAIEFYRQRAAMGDSNCMGDGGASAVGVAALIVGILASITTTVIAIVDNVQERKDRERIEEKEADQQAWIEQKYYEDLAREEKFYEDQQELAKANEKKMLIAAGILGAGFLTYKFL